MRRDSSIAIEQSEDGASEAKANGRYSIAVLGKAFDLIDLLDRQPGLTLTEISTQAEMNKATALRILANLEERRYVERDTNGRYHLGVRLLQLGTRMSNGLDLRTIARPMLKKLNAIYSETVNLAVASSSGVVYIDIIESAQGLRMAATVGAVDDVHSTAIGKSMAAHWPPTVLEAMLARRPMAPKTEKTITDRDRFNDELAQVRRLGYAIDDEENESSARCVGAPIFDHLGQCVGGISVSGPATRMKALDIDEVGRRVVDAAMEISRQLGYRPANG
jgi:DNA-binding IclR family transcriptional regulator